MALRPKGENVLGEASENVELQLEELLAESSEDAQLREANAFDKLAGSCASALVIFGAGNLGRRTLAGLRKVGIEPRCFIDNNTTAWGQNRDGLEVLSPSEGARLYGDSATFVVTIWRGEGTERMSSHVELLRQLGCKSVVPFLPLYWKCANTLLPHYMHDLPHKVHLQTDQVLRGFHLFAEDASRREYVAQMRYRLEGDFDGLPGRAHQSMYFPEDLFTLTKEEILVDCGAFDGDTLKAFLDKTGDSFKRAIAFEPDPANFAKLATRVSLLPTELRERIALHQAATGESNMRVLMDVGFGTASHIGGGDLEVECIALDSLLNEDPVSIIKMDIEGSELATLAGAHNLIKRNAPILAISAYHRQDDLWNIPLFIHSLNPEYRFYLRPHMLEGWDLVCYAIPRIRHHRSLDGSPIEIA